MQVRVSEAQEDGEVTVSVAKAVTETPLEIKDPHGAVQEAADGATAAAASQQIG